MTELRVMRDLRRFSLPQACVLMATKARQATSISDIENLRQSIEDSQTVAPSALVGEIIHQYPLQVRAFKKDIQQEWDEEPFEVGLGDPHRKKQTTALMADGTFVKNIPSADAVVFAELADLFGMGSELRTPGTLKGVRTIRQEPLPETVPLRSDEVDNFWHRAGFLAALCDVLNVDDLHYENVLVADGFPQIVDMETFFTFRRTPVLQAGVDERSILQTGLIAKPRLEGPFVAGLMATQTSGLSTNYPFVIAGKNGFELHFRNEREPAKTSLGLALERPIRWRDADGFLKGLRAAYQLVRSCWRVREVRVSLADCIASAGPARVIPAATRFYRSLTARLSISTCPTYEEGTELLLKHLVGKRVDYASEALYLSEARQIIEGDVPVFYVRPESSKLLDESLDYVTNLPASPLEQILYFLTNEMNDAYIGRQVEIVENQFGRLISGGCRL